MSVVCVYMRLLYWKDNIFEMTKKHIKGNSRGFK